MFTIQNEPYFLHQVDRWPDNGRYGDGKCIYVCNKHHPIKEFDDAKKQVYTTTGLLVKLDDNEPDFDLFLEVVGKPWDNVYKDMWKDDEDYTDYAPLVYKTIQQYLTDSGEFYNIKR